MNPFKEFTHFIALFVPGTFLFIGVVSGASLLTHRDLFSAALLGGTGLFLTVVSGAALGLLLDEARHTIYEDALTDSWTIRAGYDPEELKRDFVAYVPPMTPQLYEIIRDEGYYYYEFDLNMGMALVVAAFVVPRYLWAFQGIDARIAWAVLVILLGLGICVGLWFGYSAYVYSIRSFVSAMDNLQPGFEESIKLKK